MQFNVEKQTFIGSLGCLPPKVWFNVAKVPKFRPDNWKLPSKNLKKKKLLSSTKRPIFCWYLIFEGLCRTNNNKKPMLKCYYFRNTILLITYILKNFKNLTNLPCRKILKGVGNTGQMLTGAFNAALTHWWYALYTMRLNRCSYKPQINKKLKTS
jgi:hypothetical protein